MIDAGVVVIGVGRVGSPAALYLACADVRQIGIVDGGRVEEGDVASAPLHYAPDVGTLKAESAAQKLGVLNPRITVEPYPVELDRANAGAIVAGQDLVVECTGSPEVRELVAQACAAQGVALVVAPESAETALAGAALAAPGAVAEPPAERPGASEAPALAGMRGAAAALQAIRLLAGPDQRPASQSP